MVQNKDILDSISTEQNLLCIKCGEFMRLWVNQVGLNNSYLKGINDEKNVLKLPRDK